MQRHAVVRLLPSPDLAPLVRRYSLVRQGAGLPCSMPMVAMSQPRLAIDITSPMIVEHSGTRHVVEAPTLGGLASRPYSVHLTGAPMEVFFVDFTEVGFFAFFGDVAGAITDSVVNLWDVLPDTRRSTLVDELGEATSDPERKRAVERMLRRLRPGERALARADKLAEPVGLLELSAVLPTVRSLAADIGVSESYLRRGFRTLTGASPKSYLARQRALRAFHLLRQRPDATGAGIAQHTGFFDQAHLIRELRKHTGFTPSELRAPVFAFCEAASR